MVSYMLDGYPDKFILWFAANEEGFWLYVQEKDDDVEGGEAAAGVVGGDGCDESGFLGRCERSGVGKDAPERHDDGRTNL